MIATLPERGWGADSKGVEVDSGIYLSATGAIAAEARLDVIANNLANIETPGFKKSFTLQRERPAEAFEPSRIQYRGRPELDQVGGGLFIQEVRFDATQGGITQTGNDLDAAIQGEGWFGIAQGGETLYTRAGNFRRNAEGTLVTADGQGAVLDAAGGTIQLPAVGTLEIGRDGTVTADGEPVGQIGVFGTLDPRQFEPEGGTLYRSKNGLLPPAEDFVVRGGMLERSTAEPVREMVKMIHTFRAYETNQRLIAMQDQSLGRAVNDVGRLA